MEAALSLGWHKRAKSPVSDTQVYNAHETPRQGPKTSSWLWDPASGKIRAELSFEQQKNHGSVLRYEEWDKDH